MFYNIYYNYAKKKYFIILFRDYILFFYFIIKLFYIKFFKIIEFNIVNKLIIH